MTQSNSHYRQLPSIRYFLIFFVVLLIPELAQAQTRVTISDINAIPEENISLLQEEGADLNRSTILDRIFNDLVGQEVEVIAVMLSDPRNSGLANVDQAGRVSRVHFFVRDTSAVSMGNEGMGLQIADPNYEENQTLNYAPGDVVKLTGTVSPFGTTMLFIPSSIELIGLFTDFNLPESILDPVAVTSADVNSLVGTNRAQVNWANLASLRGQYVRMANAEVVANDLTNPDRPDFYVSNDNATTIVNFFDIGVQFRNDRGFDYPQDFNLSDSDFTPPPNESIIDIKGFLSFQNGADRIGRGLPDEAILSISPLERRGCVFNLDQCDLSIAITPPIVSPIAPLENIPDGIEAVTLLFEAEPDPGRSLSRGFCEYSTSLDATLQSVVANPSRTGFRCEIPPQPDTTFVRVRAGATDNAGATNYSDPIVYVTLADGINEIKDIQRTFDLDIDSSPLAEYAGSMEIVATVMSSPDVSGMYVIQDDSTLAPWSGILLEDPATELQPGDKIRITSAEVTEWFSVTTLRNASYTVESTGHTVLYKPMTTTELLDPFVAEAHESMMLRFVNVTLGVNPDFPSNFGEWTFTTQDEDFIRADDRSRAFPSDFSSLLQEGSAWDYIQGIWWYSFGDYKLVPESPTEDLLPLGATRPPSFVVPPTTAGTLCSSYSSEIITASTPRANLTLVDPPEGMAIKGLSGELTWYPTTPGSYAISVKADNGLIAETQTFTIEVDSIRTELSVDQEFQDANQLSSYRLLSLPGTSNLPVASTFSGIQGTDWFLFRDNGRQSSDPEVYLGADNGSFRFLPGQGYWGLSNSNWNLEPQQTALPVDQECGHNIELEEGWNVVSNPYNHDVSWNDIQYLNQSSQTLWKFEDGIGRWEMSGVMVPYEAYYVFSDSPSSLRIPFLDIEAPIAEPPEPEFIDLHALVQNDTVATARILFSEDASLNLDSLDQFAPRNAFEPVSIHFLLGEDENQALFTESRPYLPNGQRLLLHMINRSDNQVSIQLGETNLSFETALLLIDQERGLGVNLSSNVQVFLPPGSKTFQLIIGDNPTASSTENEVIPSEITLFQNYPNPFNQETTIEYALPDADWVRIELYDVLGRKVDTLVDEFKESGKHQVKWTGFDQFASGMYMYRLTVGNTVESKTLMLSR